MLLKYIKKEFNRHSEPFQKHHITDSDIVIKIFAISINTRSVSDSKREGVHKLVQSWGNDLTYITLVKITLAEG